VPKIRPHASKTLQTKQQFNQPTQRVKLAALNLQVQQLRKG